MDNVLDFLNENYIWVIVVAVFIMFTIIGYFVDRNQNKKRKEKEKKSEEQVKQDTAKTEEIVKTEEVKEDSNEDEMSNTFLKEDNYDLSKLASAKQEEEPYTEPITYINPKKEEKTEEEKSTYDRNLEYILKEQEKQTEEVESIDDFLQRTMRETYQPTIEEVKEESTENSTNIDYDDTLPIPIQKEEDFSPVEITTVDPNSFSETSEDKEESDDKHKTVYDFKPIEDAILESLDKISAQEEIK